MAAAIPTHMKACVTFGDGKVGLRLVPVPKLGPGQILVKVVAAAQNPSEWMNLSRLNSTNVVLGQDFAGTVVEIAPDVPSGLRNIGEHVAGAFPEIGGTFTEYCVADAQVLIKIPENLSFEDAAGLGLASFTAAQALWQVHTDLPTPPEPAKEPFPILIWGGASAVGQYALQLAKLSGLQVIATSSPKNHELLKSLGADAVFDYRDPNVAQTIRDFTGDKLTHAVDCIAEKGTPKLVGDSMGSNGGKVASVLIASTDRENVESEFGLVFTLLGKEMTYPYPIAANAEHYELGRKLGKILSDLLAAGKLKTTPVKLVPNGLADVQEWIEYQKEGKVSAEKITYRISDTRDI
ncbi:dehydrogenase [Mycena floridula]|nr:dehydrogenase [Mycena floridula]